MKRSVKLGISIGAVGLLTAVIVLQARAVSQFKSSAMRFVAAEAMGFVAIPDLARFFDNGIPPVNEIAGVLNGKPVSDFVRSVIPRPDGLPAQCITLGKSTDLAANGIVPASSFSLAWLDSGLKAAVQLRTDGSGLVFLTDVLFPAYAQLSYQSDQSHRQSDQPSESNNDAKYKFTFTAQSKDVDFCPEPEWQSKEASTSSLSVESSTDTIFLPMRFRNSIVGAATPPRIEIGCTVSKNLEPAIPCGCEVVEQGLGDTETRAARRTSCGQNAIAKRTSDLATWSAELGKGHTVTIGDQYVVVIDGFHVIESLPAGARKRIKYQISTPTVSIVSDDSLLSQFAAIAASDKQPGTTIFAGARPDSIVGAVGTRGLPMYLLTPVGIHFHDNKIYMDILSNLEPQDSAIVQTVAAASKSEASQRGWSNWRKALGGKLSDSSLKLYAKFLRSYFINIDNGVAKYSPLAQVAMDIMEQGAGSIVVAVDEFYSSSTNSNVARLAIAVPDIDSEIAGSIVTRSRRLSILRQARFATEKASELAQRHQVDLKNLDSAVKDFYCASPLWQLKSIVLRHGAGPTDANGAPTADATPAVAKAKPTVVISEQAFADESLKPGWSVSEAGFLFLRILPPEDPNVALWGNAYVNGTGFAQKDEAEVLPKVDEFADYLDEFKFNLNDNANDLGPVLDAMGPKLLDYAIFLESKRSFARQSGIVATISEIRAATNVHDALAKVADLQGKFKNRSDFALLGPAEIESFCRTADSKLPQSPLAFYDRQASVLFLVDDAKTISSLRTSSPERDTDGKLLVGLETPQLAKLLTGNKIINDNDAKQLREFPFARAELVLNGRKTGTGIAAQLSLSRIEKK
jgi:hypothetical protein